FPQVFIDGELIGGCDIVLGMYQTGELQTLTAGVSS
ncbi:MAG: glutaredoxin, partial [Gammaproteobacteria bacterium]